MYIMDTLGEDMVRVPDGTEQGPVRFHHPTQSVMKFKFYESFVSGVFHLVLEHS